MTDQINEKFRPQIPKLKLRRVIQRDDLKNLQVKSSRDHVKVDNLLYDIQSFEPSQDYCKLVK